MKKLNPILLTCVIFFASGCGKSTRSSEEGVTSTDSSLATVRFEFSKEKVLTFSGTENISDNGPVIPYPFDGTDNLTLSFNLADALDSANLSQLEANLTLHTNLDSDSAISYAGERPNESKERTYKLHPVVLSKKIMSINSTKSKDSSIEKFNPYELVLDFENQLNFFLKSIHESSILEITIPENNSNNKKKIRIRFFKAPFQINQEVKLLKSSEDISFKDRRFTELAEVVLRNPYPFPVDVRLPGNFKAYTEYRAEIYKTSATQCSHSYSRSSHIFSAETDGLLIFKNVETGLLSKLNYNSGEVLSDLPTEMKSALINGYGKIVFSIYADVSDITLKKGKISSEQNLTQPALSIKVPTKCHSQRACKSWSRSGGRDGDHSCNRYEEVISGKDYTQRLNGIDFIMKKIDYRETDPGVSFQWSDPKRDFGYLQKSPPKGQNSSSMVKSLFTNRIKELLKQH